MIKHLKIFWQFIRTSIIREMEFRANFIANNLINIFWAAYLIIIIEVIFVQTNSLVGWSKAEILFLLGTWMLVSDLARLTFSPNLKTLADHVFKGDLDFIMTKPLNTQFIVSTNYFNIKALPMIFVNIGIIIYAALQISAPITLSGFLLYLLLLICGILANYSLLLGLMTLNFWFIKADNLHNLWDSFTNFGRYPLAIFPRTMMTIFITFIPVGLISVFPSMAFLGRLELGWIIYALLFSIFIFWLSRKFWNFAIKYYSSASS